jgi:hypothetical protein
MNSFKDKILGEWLNSSIRYVFYEDGKLTINWIKDNSLSRGIWSIESDEIMFKYGANLHQTWKGRINHINVQELSITDVSHQKGVIDVLYRRELSIIDPIIEINNNITPTPEKKNFKEKLTETVWGVFALAFFAALLGGIGYLIYKEFKYESHEFTYFTIGIMLFVLSAIPLIFTLYKGEDDGVLFLKGYFIFYASVIIVPLLYYVFVIFFAIITLWYYIVVLGVIIALIMLVLNKEEKWLYKSVIILISIASLYFLYDAKSILKIKFEVYFDDTKVEISSDEDE